MLKGKRLRTAEAEVKAAAKGYFQTQFTDEFGYVTEKVERIDALNEGDGWVSWQMLHALVRRALFPHMSNTAKQYLIDNELFDKKGNLFTG